MLKPKAFTLIELLVVIAIIGILSGLIVIGMSGAINAADDTKKKVDISNIGKTLIMYGVVNGGRYPAEWNRCEIVTDGCPLLEAALVPSYFASLPVSSDAENPYTYQSLGSSFSLTVTLSDNSTYTYTQEDGMTTLSPSVWTSRNVAAYNWQAITYGDGKFVAVSSCGESDCVMTSATGEAWTTQSTPTYNDWSAITYGNGKFVAVGHSSADLVMTSTTGEAWSTHSTPLTNCGWDSIAYGNNRFVAVSFLTACSSVQIITSTDGITWEAQTPIESNAWNSIAYGNDVFVAVSTNGTNRVMTSTDGLSWVMHNPPVNSDWRALTFGNGKFVALGSNMAMTSTNGETWQTNSTDGASNWNSIAYGNGVFVAVSSFDTHQVMTSTDGLNWTSKDPLEANMWQSIAYGNGIFAAVSTNGLHRVMTSTTISN